MTRLGQRAVVVGGSIAGLLAARVLSDHFDRVVILERDAVEDRPVLHRSVPQGHHLHASTIARSSGWWPRCSTSCGLCRP